MSYSVDSYIYNWNPCEKYNVKDGKKEMYKKG